MRTRSFGMTRLLDYWIPAAPFSALTCPHGCVRIPASSGFAYDGCLQPLPGIAPPRMMKHAPWVIALVLAGIAGWTDWRYRRIPNWLTVPCFGLGIAANALAGGWYGAKQSLLGAGLGLLLLLPFVLLRSLGAGDWKLMGAVGACIGLHGFISVLVLTVLINGLVAIGMVIASGRLWSTFRNMFHMLGAMLTLHKPPVELTLDNPEAIKVPFGVSAAVAVAIYVIPRLGGVH